MINWNITPIFFPNGIPYILFSEMEWIGKLSYIANDLNDRTTILETNLSDLTERVTTNENDIANIKGDIVDIKADIVSLKDRVTDTETAINTLNNTTIPAIQSDIDNINNRTQILLHIPVVPYPVDTTDTRSYTIQLPTGYNICDVSLKIHGDYATEHEYYSDINMNINCKNGSCKKFDINYAPPGEYGQPTYLQHYINLTTNSAEELTISYGKDQAWWTDPTIWTDEGFPDITRIILKLYKLPNV